MSEFWINPSLVQHLCEVLQHWWWSTHIKPCLLTITHITHRLSHELIVYSSLYDRVLCCGVVTICFARGCEVYAEAVWVPFLHLNYFFEKTKLVFSLGAEKQDHVFVCTRSTTKAMFCTML